MVATAPRGRIVRAGLVTVLTARLLSVAAGAAAAPPLTFTVADITIGDRVTGETLTADSLKHRVVVLEFWNHECKDCRASLPLLEQLHRAQGPAGLLVVGAHVKPGGPVDARQAVEKAGGTFPTVVAASVKGLDRPPIPHALVFDHTGACIARGSLQDVAAKAVAAVRAAPPLVLAGRHLEHLPALEKMLRDEAMFGIVLRKATESAASTDEPTAEEATFVLECLEKHAAATIAKAEELKAVDAYGAASLLQRLATAFRGNEAGNRALEMQREWKRDKQFTAGLQAAQIAGQLETLRAQAIAQASAPSGGGYGRQPAPKVASLAAANKIPPQVKHQLAQMVGMVRQLAPESKYANRAEEIALELNLELHPGP
ncbi:MAG: TlpA disulfide reductase family protein [Planctomycetota bacterium]